MNDEGVTPGRSCPDSVAEQQKTADEAGARRQARQGPEGKQPYSVLLTDGLRAELQVSQLNLRSEEGRLRILKLQLDNTRESLLKNLSCLPILPTVR